MILRWMVFYAPEADVFYWDLFLLIFFNFFFFYSVCVISGSEHIFVKALEEKNFWAFKKHKQI